MYFIIVIEKDKIMSYGIEEKLYVAERKAQTIANIKERIVLIQDNEKKVIFVKPERKTK